MTISTEVEPPLVKHKSLFTSNSALSDVATEMVNADIQLCNRNGKCRYSTLPSKRVKVEFLLAVTMF